MERFTDLVEWVSNPTNRNMTAETRRWGFEIETPDISRYYSALESEGFSVVTDASVDYTECSCTCDQCEHECDCPNCDIRNGYDSPDHCGDCQANEASSPVLYRRHLAEGARDALEALHDDNSADMENGGHIHVEARDLTIRQISTIQSLYLKLADLMPSAFGRGFNHYAEDFEEWNQMDRLGERYCAVNATNLVRYSWNGNVPKVWADDADRRELRGMNAYGAPVDTFKTTLEFRQFASTANADIIEARAMLVRSLVDYVANGGAPYWVTRCTTSAELLQVLEPYNH